MTINPQNEQSAGSSIIYGKREVVNPEHFLSYPKNLSLNDVLNTIKISDTKPQKKDLKLKSSIFCNHTINEIYRKKKEQFKDCFVKDSIHLTNASPEHLDKVGKNLSRDLQVCKFYIYILLSHYISFWQKNSFFNLKKNTNLL